ncbi:hypothetical protein SAMN04488112_106135 [Melghirimyces thermohalophilus]|uniref:Uncharacterized protein n=1 Tax=Melghirimyces thermohalophilus TaxID=1236220 RepID=A0A1G6KSK9_9BACL|nr:hypothetical protein SAMN04488112_106135 [Melghirimyces thermohalophilus]
MVVRYSLFNNFADILLVQRTKIADDHFRLQLFLPEQIIQFW